MGQQKLYSSLEEVQISTEWFRVYRLQNNVMAICEPYHCQAVISYLIMGTEKSLLIDTGMGVANIKDVVGELTNTDVVVINTHTHFDHVGNNHLFDEVLVFDSVEAIERLKKGYCIDDVKPYVQRELFDKDPPASFDFENYYILPCNPKPIHDGDIINLGDRKIEIIYTPGHSQDSIMLLDRKSKILFTGDSYYPGSLYAYFNGGLYGKSNILAYAKSMHEISKLVSDLDFIHPSHNHPVVYSMILEKVADALSLLALGNITLRELTEGDITITSLSNTREEYLSHDDLYKYEFDGFSIIARKCHK